MSKITHFLESLGNTSEEIANSLYTKGIKGEKRNSKFCPIIKVIYQEFPTLCAGLTLKTKETFYVWSIRGKRRIATVVTTMLTWNDTQTIDPILPQAVKTFVDDFDHGKFPHLVGDTEKQIAQEAEATLQTLLENLTPEQRLALKNKHYI
jgi:hypothetical protein